MIIKGVWVGLAVEWPAIEDAHVTLAYFPEFDTDQEADLVRTTLALAGALDWWFPVATVEHTVFKAADAGHRANVVKVEIPTAPGRLIGWYRDSLKVRGLKYSEAFSFDPHVTVAITPDGEPFRVPVTPAFLRVTGVFVDWGREIDKDRSFWNLARIF